MRDILVACRSRIAAERGLHLAADLSVASGARISLVYTPERAMVASAAAGMEALSHLSTVALTRGESNGWLQAGWLAAMEQRVEECWDVPNLGSLAPRVEMRRPALVIACEDSLAQLLVEETTLPVWHLRRGDSGREWFTCRKLRCAVRGTRAREWAQDFARSLGAELEVASAGLFRSTGDLTVVERGRGVLGLSGPVVLV